MLKWLWRVFLIIAVIGALLRLWFAISTGQTPPVIVGSPHDYCKVQAGVDNKSIGVRLSSTLRPDGTKTYIGLSDGTFAFDTIRPDSQLKCQASQSLREKDSSKAGMLWTEALQQDSNDAEALIYRENQRVLESGLPIVTFIIGTSFTSGNDILIGRYTLQGAYIAQDEYNRNATKVQIRLLISNFGSNSNDALLVAQQIVQANLPDSSIKGVMGLPFTSDQTLKSIIQILQQGKLPVVLPTGSVDPQIDQASNVFHVAPSIQREGTVGAIYVQQQLHAKKVALCVDPNDAYSSNLANAFKQQFTASGTGEVIVTNYQVGNEASIVGCAIIALNSFADLIYFAGNAEDANVLLERLPKSGLYANLRVMGGNALYVIGGYTSGNYHRLDFTATAYPDEWPWLKLPQHPFFDEYPLSFSGWPPNRLYGYSRPDNHAILSYDALLTLLKGSEVASNTWSISFNSGMLLGALVHISLQGFSGQISFGTDGNPINKSVVVLKVNDSSQAQLQHVECCFLAGSA